jgi:hypothetical protein
VPTGDVLFLEIQIRLPSGFGHLPAEPDLQLRDPDRARSPLAVLAERPQQKLAQVVLGRRSA